jgi:DNA-binding response OmpR family regulator
LEVARQTQPDLIVLDVQLPGLNGFQVCQHLKSQTDTRHIPVIMFTCHDDPEAVVLGLQTGVVDYIPKDAFADAVLVETLRQMGLV